MQHESHPNEKLFLAYSTSIASAIYQSVFTTIASDKVSGKGFRESVAVITAQIADEMIVEHRKRFPLPVETSVVGRSDWDRRFGNFPEDIFAETPYRQQVGRGLRTLFPDAEQTTPADHFGHTVGSAFLKFRESFRDKNAPIPKWAADIFLSTDILDRDKASAFLHIVTMIQGQKINLESGGIKGAFDWKDAPGGFEFWENIAQSLPPVLDNEPIVFTNVHCNEDCGLNHCDTNGCNQRPRVYVDPITKKGYRPGQDKGNENV